MSTTDRSELGQFSSIVCFKAVVTGAEEALGEKAAMITLISAGRMRGKQLAEQLGLKGKGGSHAELVPLLQQALGKDGTRLCIVDKIEKPMNQSRFIASKQFVQQVNHKARSVS